MEWLNFLWDVCKVLIFPACIVYLQIAQAKRDKQRETEQENQQKLQFLMMRKLDKTSEMTHLMAQKLHDKGIINGDLETLDKKYTELDAEYEEEVRRLALLYSKR